MKPPLQIVFGVLAVFFLVVPREVSAKPNVVLVITDDQGYGDVGAHGNPIIKTPHLDKLHAQSVRLTNFHVDPTCAETRSALQTGRYSSRTGVWHTIMGRSLLRKDEVTLGDMFKANGYKTAMFGKWHLGDNYPFRPWERGYEFTLNHGGGGVSQTPDYWGNDYFDDTYWLEKNPKKYDGYCTDIWFDGAMKFIETHKDQPFFVYLSTNAPHGPYNVSPKYSNLYKNNPKVPNAAFWGMITNIDDNMARLDAKLKELNLSDNTILIFMTDNGTAAGFRGGKGFNAGMKGTKGSNYDGGHRVPFFIRWPGGGIGGGKDVDRITAHIDVMPTLAQLCGIQRPEGPPIDGKSLVPLIQGKAGDPWPNRTLVVHSQRVLKPIKGKKYSVMTDQWRYVDGKLFDIKSDPGQKTNIAKEYPKVVEKLSGEYETWWASISTRFDETCRIELGTSFDNPARLTSHDWLSGGALATWNQGQIRSGPKANGHWAVDFKKAGKYKIELRRWPRVADLPITAAGTGKRGKAIEATGARLKIGEFDQTKSVSKGDKAIVFEVKLKQGPAEIQTWFLSKNKAERGAYFVYVELLR